jgi:hypothetical protein
MKPSTGIKRFWLFCRDNYAPLFHVAFSAAWALGLLAYFGAVTPATTQMPFGLELVASIATLLVVLFFLRAADEIKDYEYDRKHNPDRPLVTGLVTRGDLYLYMAGAAVITALLNVWAVLPIAVVLVVEYLWSYALIALEHRWPRIGEGMFLAQLFTFPVNIMLSLYLLLVFGHVAGSEVTVAMVWGIVLFSSAFLHFEYSRKCAWPHQVSRKERLYLHEVGLPGALALVVLTGAVASVGTVVAFAPWQQEGAAALTGYLPLLPLALVPWSMKRFFAAGCLSAPRQPYALKPGAMIFLSSYYFTVFVHGLAAGAFS